MTRRSKSQQVATFASDRSFPYVLLCSTAGSIFSLAFVWIVSVQSYAPALAVA